MASLWYRLEIPQLTDFEDLAGLSTNSSSRDAEDRMKQPAVRTRYRRRVPNGHCKPSGVTVGCKPLRRSGRVRVYLLVIPCISLGPTFEYPWVEERECARRGIFPASATSTGPGSKRPIVLVVPDTQQTNLRHYCKRPNHLGANLDRDTPNYL
jgi:hypothetical protein